MVPALTLGTGNFGGKTDFFKAYGANDVAEVPRLAHVCLEAGLTTFDSADVCSAGAAEKSLGAAIKGRRDRGLIPTKASFQFEAGPNTPGLPRYHLIRSVDAALRRLGTDQIDLFQLHGFAAMAPPDAVKRTQDDRVTAGKLRDVGCSNFSGWHLMKALAVSEKYGHVRRVAHQACCALLGRDCECDLMPFGLDQGVGAVVWSALGRGGLGDK